MNWEHLFYFVVKVAVIAVAVAIVLNETGVGK